MEKITRYIIFVLGIFCLGCTEEEDVFDEVFQNQVVVDTSLILDYINQEFVTANQASNCFKIEYPITLNTNTNTSIKIDNEEGLRELSSSLNTDFYTTGVFFPIIANGVQIDNPENFKQQISNCGIATLRSIVDQSLDNCFRFNYPLSLIDVNSNQQFVQSKEEYEEFIGNQGINYEPIINYPITVNSNSGAVALNNNFDFYQMINSCDFNCNEFTVSVESQNNENTISVFLIEPQTANTIEDIQWFKDGELIENEKNRILILEFSESGNFKICAEVKFANCLQVGTFCNTVVGLGNEQNADGCHDFAIELTQVQTQSTPAIFQINTEFENEIERIAWFINGDLIAGENGLILSARIAVQPTTVEICAEVKFMNCNSTGRICEFIIIQPEQLTDCDMFFPTAIRSQQILGLIEFFVNQSFRENFPDAQYEWVIDNTSLIGAQELIFEGESFDFQFFRPGTYEVCVKATNTDCPEPILESCFIMILAEDAVPASTPLILQGG